MTNFALISEQLSELRLPQGLKEYRRQNEDASFHSMSFDDRLELILNAEINSRINKRIERRIKEANLRIKAYPEEVDKTASRGLSDQLWNQLIGLGWFYNRHHILLSGPTGIGKTYLCCALGMAAIRSNRTVRCYKCSALLEKIAISRLDGTYRSFSAKLSNIDLLIIDDWGLSPIGVGGGRELLDIVDNRVGISSLVIASQLPIGTWYEALEEKTVADAVLDRVIHSSIKVELFGESMQGKTPQGSDVLHNLNDRR